MRIRGTKKAQLSMASALSSCSGCTVAEAKALKKCETIDVDDAIGDFLIEKEVAVIQSGGGAVNITKTKKVKKGIDIEDGE